ALEIGGRLGDMRLRISTSGSLEKAHYCRGEHERVVQLATDDLEVLPADWVYEFSGNQPASVFARGYLMLSLAELGRFSDAAEPEAEALRIAAQTQHAYTVGWAHNDAGVALVISGDWMQARWL